MLPKRGAYQPRVSCDEYEQGSCRWYDEWNYDHLLDYTANLQNLLWFAINDQNKLKETAFRSHLDSTISSKHIVLYECCAVLHYEHKWWNRELTPKWKLRCYVKPIKDLLDVSPIKGNQGTARSKEKILLTSVAIEPTTSGLDLPFLCRLSY